MVIRCGSHRTDQRTTLLRRNAISQASRTSRWGTCSAPSEPDTAWADAGAAPELAAPTSAADRSTIPGSARTSLVANPANGDNDFRMLRVLLNLRSQTLHVDVHQPGVRRVPVTPDLLEQDLASEDLPRLAGAREQQ